MNINNTIGSLFPDAENYFQYTAPALEQVSYNHSTGETLLSQPTALADGLQYIFTMPEHGATSRTEPTNSQYYQLINDQHLRSSIQYRTNIAGDQDISITSSQQIPSRQTSRMERRSPRPISPRDNTDIATGLSPMHQDAILHPNPRRFPCTVCSKAFKRKADLGRHQETIHIRKKSFQCHGCSQRFWRVDKRNEHERKQHPEVLANETAAELQNSACSPEPSPRIEQQSDLLVSIAAASTLALQTQESTAEQGNSGMSSLTDRVAVLERENEQLKTKTRDLEETLRKERERANEERKLLVQFLMKEHAEIRHS